MRTRLASSTAATQLSLGYLIQQSPMSAQRGSYRGSGFELRTDAWGMLGAGEGMLISTTARARQGSGIASTQLDAAEAIATTATATQQSALISTDANAAQVDFIAQIDPQEKGKYDGAVNGQSALKAKVGGRDLNAAKPVEKFATPVVLRVHPFDEYFHIEDEATGAKLADIPYRILRPSTGEEIIANTNAKGKGKTAR